MSTASEPQSIRLSGGCQCGAVRYALSAVPTNRSVCHCRMCQKAGGSPYMVFGTVPMAHIDWTRGAPKLFRSSSFAERGFCDVCGTPLTYQSSPKTISVTLASLDDPAAFPPECQWGIEGRLSWLDGIDALPGETTQNWIERESHPAIVSYQHPDHD